MIIQHSYRHVEITIVVDPEVSIVGFRQELVDVICHVSYIALQIMSLQMEVMKLAHKFIAINC